MNKCFFSNTRWTQLLAPLEIIMSKISLKYSPIHIHNFEHPTVIMNMKLSSYGFLFHRNINRVKNKAQIGSYIRCSLQFGTDIKTFVFLQ